MAVCKACAILRISKPTRSRQLSATEVTITGQTSHNGDERSPASPRSKHCVQAAAGAPALPPAAALPRSTPTVTPAPCRGADQAPRRGHSRARPIRSRHPFAQRATPGLGIKSEGTSQSVPRDSTRERRAVSLVHVTPCVLTSAERGSKLVADEPAGYVATAPAAAAGTRPFEHGAGPPEPARRGDHRVPSQVVAGRATKPVGKSQEAHAVTGNLIAPTKILTFFRWPVGLRVADLGERQGPDGVRSNQRHRQKSVVLRIDFCAADGGRSGLSIVQHQVDHLSL